MIADKQKVKEVIRKVADHVALIKEHKKKYENIVNKGEKVLTSPAASRVNKDKAARNLEKVKVQLQNTDRRLTDLKRITETLVEKNPHQSGGLFKKKLSNANAKKWHNTFDFVRHKYDITDFLMKNKRYQGLPV